MGNIRWPDSFQAAYCARFQCGAGQFARRVFWRCLYPHAAPAARVLLWVWPRFFQMDFEGIAHLGQTLSWQEFNAELATLTYHNHLRRGSLRGLLRLRVSGRRMRRLAHELFEAAPDSQASR